jgi:hypothetical protein
MATGDGLAWGSGQAARQGMEEGLKALTGLDAPSLNAGENHVQT